MSRFAPPALSSVEGGGAGINKNITDIHFFFTERGTHWVLPNSPTDLLDVLTSGEGKNATDIHFFVTNWRSQLSF